MNKTLLAMTMLLLGGLLVATRYAPDDPFLWLVNTSFTFTILRGSLFGLMVVLFFSRPPRPIYLRAFLMLAAVATSIATSYLLVSYQLRAFDAIIFLEVAVILAIEALEYDESAALRRAARRSGQLA